MSRTTKTEQAALWDAIKFIATTSNPHPPFMQNVCSVYDKLTGMKYNNFKSTYDFVSKVKPQQEGN